MNEPEDKVRCPSTGHEIFADAAMLVMKEPMRIACPGCNESHMWDPKVRRFTATDPPKKE